MFNFIKKLFSVVNDNVQPLPAKDPMDWKLTESSTPWHSESYCPICKHETCHNERMTDMCNSCGGFENMMRHRSVRKIWNGTKWCIQRKYGNKETQYTID